MALCGDVAYSGSADEYVAARNTLLELQAKLREKLNIEPHFIVIPGNHDCDFNLDDAVRDALIKSIPRETLKLSEPSIVQQCVKVQKHFWDFASQPPFRQPDVNLDYIYTEHNITCGTRVVQFRCYNTAWVSQNPEQPGRMAIPRQYLQAQETDRRADLRISLLHHPTHWLTPNRKREADLIIDRTSDLVFFGHEHVPEEYIKSDFDGAMVEYIYGGVFQASPNECPGQFNVLLFDFESKSHKINKYGRSGSHFRSEGKSDGWIPLTRPNTDNVSGFRLSQTYTEFLEDAEVEFAHRSGRRLKLDDIFITPDFKILSLDNAEPAKSDGKLLKSERFDSFLREKKKLIVLGRERSGRTCLSKKVFWSLYRAGLIPLILDGEKLTSAVSQKPNGLIEAALLETYINPELPHFDQTESERRALIIDGFEKSRLSAAARLKFLQSMERKFGTILVLGDPLMLVEEVASGTVLELTLPSFTSLEIREFGRNARRRLIRRWYSIGAGPGVSSHRIEAAEAERVVDTLLGRSFLPSYPIFILSFLQTIESTRPMDNIGSFGYHYEAFITNALTRNHSRLALDIRYQFLSDLAYSLYQDKEESIDCDQLRMFHKKYCLKYGIDPDLSDLKDGFIASRLLEFDGESYKFKYMYAYYFFVARFFRDHLHTEDVQVAVRSLCQNFHVEQNAHIWTFLAHLSKSHFLLEVIGDQARKLFSEFESVKLEEDVQFLREARGLVPELKLPASHPDENTEQHYEAMDKLDAAEQDPVGASKERDSDYRDIFMKIDAMVRTIQVLGQLLKNFPGSLTAEEKFGIVFDGFNLGLRGLGFILKVVDDGKDDLVEFIGRRVVLRHGGELDYELKDRIRNAIFGLLRLNIFSMIKLISHGLGAKGEESTYQGVVSTMDTKAAKLIEVSVGLDTLKLPRRRILELRAEFENDQFCKHLLGS